MGAKEARLSIMVGGEQEAFDKVLPLLELMGKNIVYQGPAGSGQHTKMANQIVIAGTMMGVCEATSSASFSLISMARSPSLRSIDRENASASFSF